MADSISIEETNKIRVALGLKPLPVTGSTGLTFKETSDTASEEDAGSTLESRLAQGYENWKKLHDEAEAKAQRQVKVEAIKKARDASQRFVKLEGKSLGEEDDGGDLDAKGWLKQQKKRQKLIEKTRRLEQE